MYIKRYGNQYIEHCKWQHLAVGRVQYKAKHEKLQDKFSKGNYRLKKGKLKGKDRKL